MSEKLSNKSEIKRLTKELKKSIENYLEIWVKNPALQTVNKEFTVQKDVGTMLVLFKLTEGLILDHGSEIYLDNLTEMKKDELEETISTLRSFIDEIDEKHNTKRVDNILKNHVNKKNLLAYLIREINWISVSILSSSYISSLILIRSIFELLIGIATSQNGSMTGRIESITYLSQENHKYLKKVWNKLNAWAHPSGKWEKQICPVFYSHQPLYHPTLYKECFSKLAMLTDFFLTIAVERFKISPEEIKTSNEQVWNELVTDYSEYFPIFLSKLK